MLSNNDDLQNFIYKILLLTIIMIGMSVITLIAWNSSLSVIFDIKKITFYEAFWLNLLCHILFRPIEISFDKQWTFIYEKK